MVKRQRRNDSVVTGRSRVRNQVDDLEPFGKALILITKSLGEDFKAVGPLVA